MFKLKGLRKIKELDNRSKEISWIGESIDNMVDKTDMLTLNATVVLIRSGKQGRTFAMLADQMGKLFEDAKITTRKDEVAWTPKS